MSKNAKSDKIYLDYAACTPIDKDILLSMLPFFHHPYANPSSMHQYGRNAKKIIEEARVRIARCINTKNPQEIIFTGSGTESDNLAIIGIARANKKFGNHIIVSSIEHKAILEPAKQLEKEGFEITVLPVDKYGMINVEECIQAIRKETILISIMYANNEIGTIQPISELSEAIKKYRGDSMFPILHTDACQAAQYLDIDISKLGVDMMSLNSSKIYGPKGIGLLFKKQNIKISPIVTGGEQERNLRAGTENIALIHGFSLALEEAVKNRKKESSRLATLQKFLIGELQKKIPQVRINGHLTKRLPNNVHISIPKIEGESMVLMLDEKGVEVATGSACSTFDLKPSHVLLAVGQDENIIHGSLRITFGRDTDKKKLSFLVKILPKIVDDLTNISPIK